MNDTKPTPEPAPRKRSAMQFVHSVTGDRDAEAKSLSARSHADATQADARLAVARAYGETADEPTTDEHIASIEEAEYAQHQREDAREEPQP